MATASMAFDAPRYDVLIVGAGHGGAQAAAALRRRGFAGSIGLLGEEPDPPYERPPLSKDYLSGARPFRNLLLRHVDFWAENNVDILTGRRVTEVDPVGRRVGCANGQGFGYGTLVWAAGGSPRRLSCAGHDLVGVHALRTRLDVDRLRAELETASRVVVIGGGYLGLEAAAVLASAGKQVTVLEALDRVLARVAAEPLSRFYEAEHRARGVDVRLDATVDCIEGRRGRIDGVRLRDGTMLACDVAIVAIGIVPAVAPLLAAGAVGGNGVKVDAQCLTSLPEVFAIGDCALHANRHAGGATIRLESIQNANDQASVVAEVLTGETSVYDAVPWFWSHQYDLKLQTVGLTIGHDAYVLRGDPESRSFSIIYLKSGKVVAADCLNATRDYVQAKRLVEKNAVVAPGLLVDISVQLRFM